MKTYLLSTILCISLVSYVNGHSYAQLETNLFQQEWDSAWLGLEVTDVPLEVAITAGLEEAQGALVQKVIDSSPAEEAGIRIGDIVRSFNGRRIKNAKDFKNDLAGTELGTEIEMCVARMGYRFTVYAVPQERPLGFPVMQKIFPWLGVAVSEVIPESRESDRLEKIGKEGGVLIEEVAPGSPAEKGGLRAGDVIMSFNHRKVRTKREFLTDLCGAEVGDRARLCIMSGDIRKTVYPLLETRPQILPIFKVSEKFDLRKASILSDSSLFNVLPQAIRFVRELEPVPHYKGYGEYGRLLGIAFITTEICPEKSFGYQSKISTLVGVSTKGKIVGIEILQENESCYYAKSLFPQFIRQFIDKSVADDFVLGKDIDGISGATITASAINRSVRTGLSIISYTILDTKPSAIQGQTQQVSEPVIFQKADTWILFFIVGLAVCGYIKKSQLIRYTCFGLSFIYIGFIKGCGFSINNIIIFLKGYFPAFQDNPYWYGLLIVVVIFTLFLGRFYCGWICPFGFFLELLHRIGGSKISLPYCVDGWLISIKYVILTIILFIAFIIGTPDKALTVANTVEAYCTFFKLSGNSFNWLLLIFILACSLFISRAYCRYLCPLGAFLAFLTFMSSVVKSFVFKIYHPEKHYGLCPVGATRYDQTFRKIKIDNMECIKCYVGISPD